eukprot:g28619.t1
MSVAYEPRHCLKEEQDADDLDGEEKRKAAPPASNAAPSAPRRAASSSALDAAVAEPPAVQVLQALRAACREADKKPLLNDTTAEAQAVEPGPGRALDPRWLLYPHVGSSSAMWRTWLLLSVAGGSGERVVEPNSLLQATLRASDSPVQRIGPKEWVGIVHIGKTGGSSLDSWLKGNIGRRHLLGHGIHCDMSYMDAQAKKQGHPVRVLSFLREPGTRAASQVLFWNTFKWPLFQRLAVKMGETCLEDGIG